MKRFSFTVIGISIIIMLNLLIAGILANAHHKGHHNKHMKGQRGPVKFHQRPVHQREAFQGSRKHNRMKDLNLTEEQKQKMEVLRKEQREKAGVIIEKIDGLHTRELELQKAGKLDEVQVNAFAVEYGTYQKELHQVKLNHLQAFNSLLTDEQRTQMQKKFQERRNAAKRDGALKN